ncbi:MAG: PAS domain S-box protein, partial [Spirochaetaceae bacterium]
TYFSPVYYTMLGYENQEYPMSFETFNLLIHPNDKERVMPIIQDAIVEGKPYSVDFRLLCKDGSWRWINGRGKTYQDEHGTPYRAVGVHIDIDDLKQAEQKNRYLSAVTANMHDSIVTTDTDLRINYANQQTEKQYGYTAEEMLGQSLGIFYAESSPELLDEIRTRLADGQGYSGETIHRRKDGSTFFCEYRLEPLLDEAGKVVAYIGLQRDTTAQREAQQALMQSEEYYRALMQSIPDLIFIMSRDGTFLDYKADVHELYVDSHSFLGKKISDVMPEDVAGKFEKAIKELSGKAVAEFAYSLVIDGVECSFNSRLVALGNKDVVAFVRDISDQVASELTLENNKRQMDMFFAQSLNGFFFMMLDKPIEWNDLTDKEAVLDYVFDHQRITRVNQAMLDQYGAQEKDFVGLTPSDFFSHDLVAGRRIWREMFDNGRWHVDTEEKKFDGTPMIVEGDYICLYDDLGRITGHFGVQFEVTEQRNAQEALEKAKLAAEEANKAKSQFLANMSHEIRTPLNGVIGFTELLKTTPLSPVQQQYVDNTNISGHTLLGIINDILDFSKIEAGMMTLEYIRTDMLELLENSADIVQYAASQKGLELLLDIDPQLPCYAMTDPVRLKQILANLLGNAVKFTKAGEVELKIGFSPSGNAPDKGVFHFAVRDTGIGISEAQRQKLFKAFSQADSSTTRNFGGTGLGLIISDMIARQMGGKIELESVQGKGTT